MRKLKSKKKEIIEFTAEEIADIQNTVHYITEDTNQEACLINLINDPKIAKNDFEFYMYLRTILELTKERDRNRKFSIRQSLKKGLPALLHKHYKRFYPNKNTEVFTIVLELILILIEYASLPNKLIEMYKQEKYRDIYLEWNPGMKMELLLFPEQGTIAKNLGYEPAFSREVKEKFQECVNWLANTFYRRIKYNTKAVLVDRLNFNVSHRLNDVYKVVFEETNFTKDAATKFKKECTLFNELTGRVVLLRSAIKHLEEENKKIDPLNYKKDLTHFKSTVTRLENLLEMLHNLLNFGGEPTQEDLEEFENDTEIKYI